MNTIHALFERLMPLVKSRLPHCLRRRLVRRRHAELQLEFPWCREK
jgi:hypothetical protein